MKKRSGCRLAAAVLAAACVLTFTGCMVPVPDSDALSGRDAGLADPVTAAPTQAPTPTEAPTQVQTQPPVLTDEEQIAAVNDAVTSWFETEDPEALAISERITRAGEMIQDLVREGAVAEESVIFDADSDAYVFRSPDGIEYIIDLSEPEEGVMGSSTLYKPGGETVQIERYPEAYADGRAYYGGERKALIVDTLEDADAAPNYREQANEWSKCHLDTDYVRTPSVEFYREELFDYDIVFLRMHGAFKNNEPRLLTGIRCDVLTFEPYINDLVTNRMSFQYCFDAHQFVLNASFFRHYYAEGKGLLDGQIIFLSACHSYQNDALVKAFAEADASAVIGATDAVKIYYENVITDYFVYSLFEGKNVCTALDNAKWYCGSDDSVKCGGRGTTYNIYTGDQATLFLVAPEALADPQNAEGSASYLDELPIVEYGQYDGNEGDSFVYTIGIHSNSRGNTDIDGNLHEHGIEGWIARWNGRAEQSWAYAVYDLSGAYEHISGEYHLIHSYNTTDFDTTLTISGDGAVLFETVLTPETATFPLELDVTGVSELKISFYDNTEKCGGTAFGLTEMSLQ